MAADISVIDALFDQARKCCRCSASLAGRSQKAKYCEPCRRLARIEKDRRKRVKQKERGYVRRTSVERICEHCSKRFFPREKAYSRFCSRDCSFAKQKAEAKGERFWAKVAPRCSVRFQACEDCGALFTSRRPAKRCSTCRDNVVYYVSHYTVKRACVACGTEFEQTTKDGRPTEYCSSGCRTEGVRRTRRIAKGMREARERAQHVEAVDPFKVFARDKWRCQECGVKTPRKLRGTYDDRAPELDHIIPLSQGGEHSYRNTQCLCRACNGAKSDNIRGQLRLFG